MIYINISTHRELNKIFFIKVVISFVCSIGRLQMNKGKRLYHNSRPRVGAGNTPHQVLPTESACAWVEQTYLPHRPVQS